MVNIPPGMPPGLPVQTTTACITPKQAAKGPAELLEQPGEGCTVTGNRFAGGRIESAVRCTLRGDTQRTSRWK